MFGKPSSDCDADALEAARASVQTQGDFTQFTELLLKNYRQHLQEWEHVQLGSFLEALTAYSNDVGSFYQNRGEQKDLSRPDWNVFATILLGAKVYE